MKYYRKYKNRDLLELKNTNAAKVVLFEMVEVFVSGSCVTKINNYVKCFLPRER